MLKLYVNIKKRREELGMSQDELAKLTGYTSRSSIAKIEKGLVDLPQTKIELFAKALNTTQPELMGWNDNLTLDNAGTLVNLLTDAELLEYIKKLNNMTSKQRYKVYGYIDNLLD